MNNRIFLLFIPFLIAVSSPVYACEHTSLQHQFLLDTYLEFPVAHAGIVNCQHLDFDERGDLILLQLNTPKGPGLITNIVLLIQGEELVANHILYSMKVADVQLETERSEPSFNCSTSPAGRTEYYTFKAFYGFAIGAHTDQ